MHLFIFVLLLFKKIAYSVMRLFFLFIIETSEIAMVFLFGHIGVVYHMGRLSTVMFYSCGRKPPIYLWKYKNKFHKKGSRFFYLFKPLNIGQITIDLLLFELNYLRQLCLNLATSEYFFDTTISDMNEKNYWKKLLKKITYVLTIFFISCHLIRKIKYLLFVMLYAWVLKIMFILTIWPLSMVDRTGRKIFLNFQNKKLFRFHGNNKWSF